VRGRTRSLLTLVLTTVDVPMPRTPVPGDGSLATLRPQGSIWQPPAAVGSRMLSISPWLLVKLERCGTRSYICVCGVGWPVAFADVATLMPQIAIRSGRRMGSRRQLVATAGVCTRRQWAATAPAPGCGTGRQAGETSSATGMEGEARYRQRRA
jgi:hypothetical protein